MACYRSSIYLLVESLWPLIGHICVCLLNRCGLLSVMYLSANGIVVAYDRSCICVLVESLLPVIVHVFVCLLNRCSCYRSCICVLVESLWPVIGHVFVCFLNHCGLLSVMYLCAC